MTRLLTLKILNAAEVLIVSFKLSSRGWTSHFKFSHENRNYSCDLKLSHFCYLSHAQVPTVLFEFDRHNCTPALEATHQNEILTLLTLKVEMLGKNERGLIQWLRYAQTSECLIDQFDRKLLK